MIVQDMEYYSLHEVRMAKRKLLEERDIWTVEPGTQAFVTPEGLAPMLFVCEDLYGQTGAVVGRRLVYHGAQVEVPDLGTV